MSISEPIRQLLQEYWRPHPHTAGEGEDRVNVTMTITKLAHTYERIRNAIEYKDEHLLRKNAIERILKRRIYVEGRTADFGRMLMTELIRARYLENNKVPVAMLGTVDAIVIRYLPLLKNFAPNRMTKERRAAANWLLSILAADIDHTLANYNKQEALVNAMYRVVQYEIDLSTDIISERERGYQLYIAIHRALIRSDPAIVRYHLLNFILPGWFSGDPASVQYLLQHFGEVRQYIDHQTHHPLGGSIMRAAKKYAILFNVLGDIMDTFGGNFEQLVNEPVQLAQEIREACAKRYQLAHTRLRRSFFRAVIYIFITKMLLALILELPYDLYVHKETDYLPLAVNVFFHLFLMFTIIISISMPSKENTEKIVTSLTTILTEEPHPRYLGVRKKGIKRSTLMTGVFRVVYVTTFVLSFAFLIWALNFLNFNIVSGLIFLFFFAIISFFGVKLRGEIRDLIIVEMRGNPLNLLIDFFTVPIVHFGRWLSDKSPKINVFLFILDGIIETPLKEFIDIVEDWSSFQPEKKEENY